MLRRDQDYLSWGFRLQGGVNFAAPLTVQSVQPNSIAAQAGLMAGDGVLKINGKNADLMEHEEAKEEIVKSGNEVSFFVQRAGVVTWSPRVPAGPEQVDGVGNSDPAAGISRISLAVNRPTGTQNIGSSYNRVPKPFGASNAAPAGPAIVVGPTDQRTPPVLSMPPGTTILPVSNGGRLAAAQPTGNASMTLSTTIPKPIAVAMPPTNIIVGCNDDDPLPPPPPPLNGAMAAPVAPVVATAAGMPLRGVSTAAAAAAADRAARLAAERSISPASLSPALTVDVAGGRALPVLGRPVSPQSLSPSYHSKVSHIRSRSAELLQQYADAAEQEQVPPSSEAQQQQQIQQQKSAVLLALEQEEEFKRRGAAADAGRRPSADAVEEEPQLYKGAAVKSRAFRMLEQEIERGSEVKSTLSQPSPSAAPSATPGFRSVTAPQPKADGKAARDATDNGASADSGPMHCYSCGGLITGVFAKVRGRPIHSDCIRCHRCRLPLKTAGYFIVNEHMYCEQHAKEATRPAAGGYTAYVVDAPVDGSSY